MSFLPVYMLVTVQAEDCALKVGRFDSHALSGFQAICVRQAQGILIRVLQATPETVWGISGAFAELEVYAPMSFLNYWLHANSLCCFVACSICLQAAS